jgi:phosphodiesterase/alkaline phosphatase D-like protein
MAIRIGSAATRRRFLATSGAATALTAIGGIARPFISRANDRPLITHGLQSGDVSIDSGVIWARADRPSRMLVEIATTDSFKDIRNAAFVDALPESDFTAKLLVENLPAAQEIFYRGCVFRILLRRPLSAKRKLAVSAPRRPIAARSVSCGRAILPGKAGASMNRVAACALT